MNCETGPVVCKEVLENIILSEDYKNLLEAGEKILVFFAWSAQSARPLARQHGHRARARVSNIRGDEAFLVSGTAVGAVSEDGIEELITAPDQLRLLMEFKKGI